MDLRRLNEGWIPVPGERTWGKFQAKYEVVVEDYLSGKNIQQISRDNDLPTGFVRMVVSKAALRQLAQNHQKEMVAELVSTKIPLLREVVGLSLATLKDFLIDLQSNETKKAGLTVKDAKDLSSIAKEINEIARLEQGKSTQNVEIIQRVEKDVTILLDELRSKDPFVEYPNGQPESSS